MGELAELNQMLETQDLTSLKRLDKHGCAAAVKQHNIVKALAAIQKAILKQEEERLGPMLYEITADDLFSLSPSDRMHVFNSGAMCFNNIIPVRLVGVKGCGKASIERIMEWRRSCVMRITEEQVVEAIEGSVDA